MGTVTSIPDTSLIWFNEVGLFFFAFPLQNGFITGSYTGLSAGSNAIVTLIKPADFFFR
jgi:hypothetical protein